MTGRAERERDRIMLELDVAAAMRSWDYEKLGPPAKPDVVLAALHKARLMWTGCPIDKKMESMAWLAGAGYEIPRF
jgi:hypothetical protein